VQVVALAVVGILFLKGVGGWLLLGFIILFTASFASAMGPIPWIVISEIFPTKIRGWAMSIATLVLWTSDFIVSQTFPKMVESIGKAITFWIYAACSLAGMIFIILAIPETKGKTLEEIEAGHVPVVVALNKLDQLSDPDSARATLQHFPQAVAISALTGDGVDELLDLVRRSLYETFVPILVRLPYQQGQLISLFHEFGQLERVEHGRTGVLLQGRIPGRLAARFSAWKIKPGESKEKEEPNDPMAE
jgi:MFS family permease